MGKTIKAKTTKLKHFNPWTIKKEIGQLLAYDAVAGAYDQLVFSKRFRNGMNGCPYCKQLSSFRKRADTPYRCPWCHKEISPYVGTPMHKSRIPVTTWMDCMYLCMGGYETEKKVAPIHVAWHAQPDVLVKRYGLTWDKAVKLMFGVREMVYPSMQGIWGDEQDYGRKPKDITFTDDDFKQLLVKACIPLKKS